MVALGMLWQPIALGAAFAALVLWVVLVRRLSVNRPGLVALPAAVLAVAAATAYAWRTAGRSLPAIPAGVTPANGGHIEPSDPRVAHVFTALREHGLVVALTELQAAAARDSAVLRDAHQLAHALGRDAVTGGDVSALKFCQPVFGAGCYHGVVEAFLQARGHVDMSELEQVCMGAGSPERQGATYECFHGLGHGILGALNLDLDSTLHECDRLKMRDGASWCHAGAFMEGINATLADLDGASAVGHLPLHRGMDHGGTSHRARQTLVLDPSDPYSPCDRYADPYAVSCWMFQAFVLLRAHAFDGATALRACDSAPTPEVERCYYGVGLQLAGLFQRDDAWLVAQCARGQASRAPACAAGAVRALGAIDWSGARGGTFCRASPADWKSMCYREVAAMLTVYGSAAERRAACARFESNYTSACREKSAGARQQLSIS